MKKNISISTLDGKPFEITKEGSLGLLALGYIGIMVWREKIKELAAKPVEPGS